MLTSLTGSSDSSPTRLPIRQKGSLFIPLLPALDLPPLPPITNPSIRRMSLTHSSAHQGDKSRKRDLIMNQAEAVLDYEKLEHVGDGLLTAAVITLLHDKYPAFGAGPATYLRGHMVSNRTLAQIAEQYKIPEMVIAEQNSKYMLQAGEKVKGSLFEAYVAGVYYSFLHPRDAPPPEQEAGGSTGVESDGPTASASDDESERKSGDCDVESKAPVGDDVSTAPSGTAQGTRKSTDNIPLVDEKAEAVHDGAGEGSRGPKSDTEGGYEAQTPPSRACPTPEQRSVHCTSPLRPAQTPRTHGQAFDHICTWLWPLFLPVAEFLKTRLGSQTQTQSEASTDPDIGATSLQPNQQAAALVPEDWKVEDRLAAGAVGALNQFLGKTYGCGHLPTWLTKRKGEQVWKMTCIVRTPEGKEIRSEAKRLTKRGAMNVAAYRVWLDLKAWEEVQAAKRAEEASESEGDEGMPMAISAKWTKVPVGRGVSEVEQAESDDKGEGEGGGEGEGDDKIGIESQNKKGQSKGEP